MSDPTGPSWPPRAFRLAAVGGMIGGLGLAVLIGSLLGSLSRGITPTGQFVWAAVPALVGWALLLERSPTPRWRDARAAFGTAGILLVLFGWLNHEGHWPDQYATGDMRYNLIAAVEWQDERLARTGRYDVSLPEPVAIRFPGGTSLSPVLTPAGWAATARHTQSTRVCAVFIGSTPLPPAVKERVSWCSRGSIQVPTLAWALGLLLGGVLLGEAAHRRRSIPTGAGR